MRPDSIKRWFQGYYRPARSGHWQWVCTAFGYDECWQYLKEATGPHGRPLEIEAETGGSLCVMLSGTPPVLPLQRNKRG